MLTGYQYAYLAIFERDTGIFHDPIYIERNEKFIQENTERVIRWWQKHMEEPVDKQDRLNRSEAAVSCIVSQIHETNKNPTLLRQIKEPVLCQI